jgi:putative tricarboxylic transport membrane protein
MMMLAGLSMVTYMSGGSLPRALLMAAFGLLLGTIGLDPMNMTPRLTFDILTLADGVNLVPLAIGLFGLSEVLFMARREESELKILAPPKGLSGFLPTAEEARRSVAPVGRGTVLGFLVGLLPGGGAVIASFLSYAVERKLSKHPEQFGKGAVEGLAGPEAANNAGTTGAFVPLLCMGIPANAITALLLGAFMIHGVAPGPQILERAPEVFWGVVASMYIGNVMLLVLNLPLIGLFVKILDIPRVYLTPMILLVCLIGVYSNSGNPADVVVAVIFGFVGYYLRRHGFDLGIVILAYVLGPIFERSVRQALSISDGDPMIFLHSKLSIGFALAAAVILLAGLWPKRKAVSTG